MAEPRACIVCEKVFKPGRDSRITCSDWCSQKYRERNTVMRRYCPYCDHFSVKDGECLRCKKPAHPKYVEVEWELDEDELNAQEEIDGQS